VLSKYFIYFYLGAESNFDSLLASAHYFSIISLDYNVMRNREKHIIVRLLFYPNIFLLTRNRCIHLMAMPMERIAHEKNSCYFFIVITFIMLVILINSIINSFLLQNIYRNIVKI